MDNQFCETPNCSSLAQVFGLKGITKERCCKGHIASLVDKKMTIYSIAGYNFITSHEDALAFEGRRMAAEIGLANLAVVEASCEKEFAAALQHIESQKTSILAMVERRFEEMKLVTVKKHSEVTEEISSLRTNLEQYPLCKDISLLPSGESICSKMLFTPQLFRFSITDVSDSIAQALVNSWTISTDNLELALKGLNGQKADQFVTKLLTEASAQSHHGLTEALQYCHFFFAAVNPSLDKDAFVSQRESVIAETLKRQQSEAMLSMEWLQRSWDLSERYACVSRETVSVGRRLGRVLALHCGKYEKADEILRATLDVESRFDPQSEEAMGIWVEVCRAYFHCGKFEEVETAGVKVLRSFADAGFPAEKYWTLLLFVAYSLNQQSKFEQLSILLEEWGHTSLAEENAVSKVLKLVTLSIDSSPVEAEKLCTQAQLLADQEFLTSDLVAFNLHLLSVFCSQRKEECCRRAQRFFECVAPMSVYAARTLSARGVVHERQKQWSEAEQCYSQAQHIYTVAAPKCAQAAHNLFSMGGLLESQGRTKDAEPLFQAAASLYARNGHERMKSNADRAVGRLKGELPLKTFKSFFL